MSYELIRSFMEAIDANRIENSGEFKYIVQAFPTLGKDLRSLLTRQDYARFLDFCGELLDANKNQKTSPLFPELDKKSIAAILAILRYMKNEEPNLVTGKPARQTTDPVWNHATMATTDRIREQIEHLIVECEAFASLLEAIN